MGDAGIDRDHEIQLRYERRRIRKISKLVAQSKNIAAFIQNRRIVGADILLQADEGRFDIQN